jgi:hypothetical protein
MKTLKSFVLASVAVLLLAGVLSAQAPTAGRILGIIVDDQGGPLPGVSIEAKGPRLVGSAATVSDTNGTYRLLALPPGTYTITFSLQGFTPIVRNDIVLGVEQALTVDIKMKPAAIEEEVVVTGQAPLIDVKSQARGQVLTAQAFDALPKGRSFDSLVTIIAGVQNENDLLGGISVDGASGAENVFYVDGTDTSDVVNGTRKQDVIFDFAEEVQVKASGYNAEYGGSVGGVVNVITRSGGNSFHGEVVGYYSGTALEGQRRDRLYFDMTDDTKAAYYPYEIYVGKDKENSFEGGFMLGGYIKKDKVWFFTAFTPRYFNRNRAMDMTYWGGSSVNAYDRVEQSWNGSIKLSAQPTGKLRTGASVVMNLFKYHGGSDPMTYPGDQTYAASANEATDYNPLGYSYPNFSASAYADLTLSNSSLLSVRGGYFYSNQNDPVSPVSPTPYYAFRLEQPCAYAPVTNDMFPEIPAELQHPAGWQSFPRAQVSSLDKRLASRLSFNTDFTHYLSAGGEHAIKAGVQFMRRHENVNDGAQQPIVYLGWDQNCVAYGTDYGRGAYGYYAIRGFDAAGPYGENYNVNMNSWAFFLQDSWTIGRKLTLNVGLRTESEYLPSYTADPAYADARPVKFSFADKLSPRLGFAYDVFGDSSLKVFGSYGIFQDVMKLSMGANALGGLKWKSAYYTLDDWDYTKIGVNGYFPGTLLNVIDFRPPVFESIDPDMKPFTQQEISLGVEKKLTEDSYLSMRLVNKKVLWAIEDIGIPIEQYYTGNPGSAWINEKMEEQRESGNLVPGTPNYPKAKRDYYAMNLSLEKRFSHNWQGGLSYTLSRLAGNYSGLASSDEDGRNSPNTERSFDMWHLMYDKALNPIDGPLATDRTHSIKAYGSYAMPFGLTLGLVANANSGTPVTEDWFVDSEGYFPYNRGNLGRTPFVFFTNLYAEYQMRLGQKSSLRFSLNVDNLFNARTATRIFTTKYRYNISPGDEVLVTGDWAPPADAVLDPRFGMAYSFMAPISGRFGVRFSF